MVVLGMHAVLVLQLQHWFSSSVCTAGVCRACSAGLVTKAVTVTLLWFVDFKQRVRHLILTEWHCGVLPILAQSW